MSSFKGASLKEPTAILLNKCKALILSKDPKLKVTDDLVIKEALEHYYKIKGGK